MGIVVRVIQKAQMFAALPKRCLKNRF